MGIVSYCPNGHRTKLKDHYAGQRVRCPQCGTKFRVDTAGNNLSATAAVDVMPQFESPFAATAALATTASAETPNGHPTMRPAASSDPTAVAKRPTEASPPAAITEATDERWCIAIPGGEPSPPMSTTEMVAWLTTAQATGNEVVWRTGWPDWRPITTTFPEFFERSS